MALTRNTLAARVRDGAGKGSARRLRAQGLVPAVVYGRHLETPVHIAVDPIEVKKAIATPHRLNTLLSLKLDGQPERLVLLKDYQQDPLSREMLHADFIDVHENEQMKVKVPLVLIGKAGAVTEGGILSQMPPRARGVGAARRIPEKIDVDVTPPQDRPVAPHQRREAARGHHGEDERELHHRGGLGAGKRGGRSGGGGGGSGRGCAGGGCSSGRGAAAGGCQGRATAKGAAAQAATRRQRRRPAQEGRQEEVSALCTGARLVVGLGTRGREYERPPAQPGLPAWWTGWPARLGIALGQSKFHGRFAAGRRREDRGSCCSSPRLHERLGRARCAAAARFYKVPPEDLLVVHDELDLPFGELQLKRGGGTGGHNGLESVVEQLRDRPTSPGSASASASPRGRTPRSGSWVTCSTTSPPRRRPPWSRSSSARWRWPGTG